MPPAPPTCNATARIPRAASARRGVVLLEVVVSISILLLGMAAVGMAFRNGALYVERAERVARATEVTQRLLGELATGLTVVAENQASGSCAAEGPQGDEGEMCWHIAITPADQIPGLLNIELEVYLGTPESKPEERQHVLTTYAQQAVFIPLNMQRDFGMAQEQLDQLTQAIPGGQAVFDPTSFDPRTIGRLDMNMLQQLLPVLIQALGGQTVAAHLDDIMKAVKTGDTSGLQDLAQQAAQGQPPPGQPGLQAPTKTPPGRPPRNPPPRPNDVPKRTGAGGGGGKR